MHVLLQNICRTNMSYQILLEGIHFVLSYSTQRWNARVTGNLFKTKIEKLTFEITKTKNVQLIRQNSQKVALHELK